MLSLQVEVTVDDDDVVTSRRKCSQLFVRVGMASSVYRLDDDRRALPWPASPREGLHEAVRVLSLGNAVEIEGKQEQEALGKTQLLARQADGIRRHDPERR